MSKLSPSLKALINAPFARPGQTPAPAGIRDIYTRIAREASENSVAPRPWLAISAAATFTLNSPESLLRLHSVASSNAASPAAGPVATAEFIREVGLKCISFNGIPRTINSLGAFRAGLPADVAARLSTAPTRRPTPADADAVAARGLALWDDVYRGFERKLLARLADSHPDLPVHILHSHYGPLLSDPPDVPRGGLASVGRGLTSLVAVACLRAQTGVGPQVVSHVFGLRKAVDEGTYKVAADGSQESEESVGGIEWLAKDEGSEWVLRSVDAIVDALGGSNFAPPKAKL